MYTQPLLKNNSKIFIFMALAVFWLRAGDVQATTSPYLTSQSDVPLNQSALDSANGLLAIGNQTPVEGSLSMLTDASSSSSPTDYVIPGITNDGFVSLTWDLGVADEGMTWKLDSLTLWMNAADPNRNKLSTEIFTSTDGITFNFVPDAREDNLQLETGANYNSLTYDFSTAPIGDVTGFQYVQLRIGEFGDVSEFPRIVETDIFASQVVVPEPSTYALALLGAGTFLVARLRRRRVDV